MFSLDDFRQAFAPFPVLDIRTEFSNPLERRTYSQTDTAQSLLNLLSACEGAFDNFWNNYAAHLSNQGTIEFAIVLEIIGAKEDYIKAMLDTVDDLSDLSFLKSQYKTSGGGNLFDRRSDGVLKRNSVLLMYLNDLFDFAFNSFIETFPAYVDLDDPYSAGRGKQHLSFSSPLHDHIIPLLAAFRPLVSKEVEFQHIALQTPIPPCVYELHRDIRAKTQHAITTEFELALELLEKRKKFHAFSNAHKEEYGRLYLDLICRAYELTYRPKVSGNPNLNHAAEFSQSKPNLRDCFEKPGGSITFSTNPELDDFAYFEESMAHEFCHMLEHLGILMLEPDFPADRHLEGSMAYKEQLLKDVGLTFTFNDCAQSQAFETSGIYYNLDPNSPDEDDKGNRIYSTQNKFHYGQIRERHAHSFEVSIAKAVAAELHCVAKTSTVDEAISAVDGLLVDQYLDLFETRLPEISEDAIRLSRDIFDKTILFSDRNHSKTERFTHAVTLLGLIERASDMLANTNTLDRGTIFETADLKHDVEKANKLVAYTKLHLEYAKRRENAEAAASPSPKRRPIAVLLQSNNKPIPA